MTNLLETAKFSSYIGDIVVVLILLLAVFIGTKRGFLSGVVTIVLATLLCRPLATVFGNTFVLSSTFENFFSKTFNFSNELYTKPINSLSEDDISTALGWLKLPSFLSSFILAQINDHSADLGMSLQSLIVGSLSKTALIAMSWVTLFLFFMIIFTIIKRFIREINKIAIIGAINKALGALLCLIIAAFIISLIMYLFILFSGAMPESTIDYVKNSIVLGWLYDNNPLAWFLQVLFV